MGLFKTSQHRRDADNRNRAYPAEDPIQLPLDFTPDVEWVKNAPNEADEKAV